MYRALLRSSLLISMLYSHPSMASPPITPPDCTSGDCLDAVDPDTVETVERTLVHLCYGGEFNGRTYFADTFLTERVATDTGEDLIQHFDIRVAFSSDDSYVDGPVTLCQGEDALLLVSGDFAGYYWENGTTDRGLTVDRPGTYRVTVTEPGGCRKELSHTLTPSNLSIVATDAVRPLCPGGRSGGLSVLARGAGPLLFDVGSGYQQLGHFDSLASGTYTLRVQNPEGCTVQREVEVPPASPLYLFDPASRDGQASLDQPLPLPVNPNFTPRQISWLAAPGLDCEDCLVPTVTATRDADYIAEAVTPAGCVVRDTFSLAVAKDYPVFVPGAFSPNGDGHNDQWQLFPGSRVEAIGDLHITDREGRICFRQTRALEPDHQRLVWDGRYDGRLAEAGPYRYAATLHLEDGTETSVDGTITLMR